MTPQPVSCAYHGPYAVFNDEELKYIKDQLIGEYGFVAEKARPILQKIETAINNDPKFKEPYS